MNKKRKKIRLLFVIGVIVAFISCSILIISIMDKTIQLRSNSARVEFVTEDGEVSCVNIQGRFPYRKIITNKNRVIDAQGNITEIYDVKAGFSLTMATSMTLYIETSDNTTYTYILRFSDKDMTIIDGKVVE